MNSISKTGLFIARSLSTKGVVRRQGVAKTSARNMEGIGGGLERVMAGSLRRTPPEEAPILAWSLACGQEVARRTRAMKFEENILHVEVPDSGWRWELQSLAPQYLAVINRYVTQSVRRIEFVVVGGKKPVESSFKQAPTRKSGASSRI
ncbi:MAG: DUF721 domain-containing protein [Acidobacteriaceae bacterium]